MENDGRWVTSYGRQFEIFRINKEVYLLNVCTGDIWRIKGNEKIKVQEIVLSSAKAAKKE